MFPIPGSAYSHFKHKYITVGQMATIPTQACTTATPKVPPKTPQEKKKTLQSLLTGNMI